MTKKTLFIFAAICFIAALGAAQTRQTAGYVFEPEARPVLVDLGVATSRHAKLFMRTTTLYMLAVYGADKSQAQLGLTSSTDGGDTFEPFIPISEPGATVSSHGENSPSLVSSGGLFCALWEQNNPAGGSDLMFASAGRMARKFDKPVKITDKQQPSQNGFSYLGAAPNGDLYAVWLDGRAPQNTAPGSSHVYLSKSTDKGVTWSKNIPVANNVCPCCRPSLAFGAKGEVFVAWRNVDGDDMRDMKLSVSTDGGATFSQPVFLAKDNWKISGCPHTGPQMVVKGNRLYVTWHSDATGQNAGVRVAWSDDAGKTFSAPVIASAGVLDTNHPVLSLSEDDRLLLAFQGREPGEKDGWGPVRIFVSEINNNGTVSSPVVVPGSRKTASFPAVYAGTVGRTFVAWTEGTDKGVQVMLARGRRLSVPTAQVAPALPPATEKRVATKPASGEHNHQDH